MTLAQPFGKDVVYDGLQSGNNFFLGLLAGLVAAVIGAAAWMGITLATESHLGVVAIGVGALVGFAVRIGGNGRTLSFGIMGAVLTALSCLSGEVLSVVQGMTSARHDLLDTLKNVDLVPLVQRILTKTDPISYLIYAIGIFEGFKLSMKK